MSSQQPAVSGRQSVGSDAEQACISPKKYETVGPSQSQTSVASLLCEAVAELTIHQIANPRLEAEVLLAAVLETERAGLYTRLRAPLSFTHIETFRHLIQRRSQREPLQYLTSTQEFWSLAFTVDKRVLIPRPETEMVVETALGLLPQPPIRSPQSAIHILDVGTGSGCIAVALAKELPQAAVWATDLSSAALVVAHGNAQRHEVAKQITFLRGDLFVPVQHKTEGFDLIVSNPPYLPSKELATLQPEVRDWEPRGALDGGREGLDFYRRLIREGPKFLRSGGWLVMEIGSGQRTALLSLVQEQSDLTASFCVPDYAGQDRVIVARRV